jgi:hypothetical protein
VKIAVYDAKSPNSEKKFIMNWCVPNSVIERLAEIYKDKVRRLCLLEKRKKKLRHLHFTCNGRIS